MKYIHYPSSLPFLLFNMSIAIRAFTYMQPAYIRDFSYSISRIVREYLSLQPMYRSVRGFPLEQLTCHMQVSSINTHVHFPLPLKIINRNYLRFVKPLTITILTIWIEGFLKHYRWECYEIHLLSIQLAIFTFEYVNCCMYLCLYATCVHTRLFLQHVAYYTLIFVIATRVQICTRASLRETRMSYVGWQYQYPRTPSFDIKNNK